MSSDPLSSPPAPVARSRGRGLFWMGIGAFLLGIALVMVQFSLGVMVVPWYVPALTTIGAVLLLLSIVKRRTITRAVALCLLVALAGFLWYFFVSLARLPDYQGPAQVGQKIPGFQTALADGKPFTDKSLQDGTPSVMVFFRGRW